MRSRSKLARGGAGVDECPLTSGLAAPPAGKQSKQPVSLGAHAAGGRIRWLITGTGRRPTPRHCREPVVYVGAAG
jgi:hypothetical protein